MTASYSTIELDIDRRGVARLTLARPGTHNAIDGSMVDEGRDAFARLGRDAAVRVLVLSGQGPTFCAGGDIRQQERQRAQPHAERLDAATRLARWLHEVDTCPKPVIGQVNGPAYGGGVGLVCACDIAIATDRARFAMTEARLGVLPAMTAPNVVARIGAAHARRLMLNGTPITAEEAVRLGLLASAVPDADLPGAVEAEIDRFLGCAPGAVATGKQLIRAVSVNTREANIRHTAERATSMWDQPEAEQGLRSFLEKRRPAWDLRTR